MKWIKKLFGLKKKEEPKEQIETEVFDKERPQRIKHECSFCKYPILKGDKWTKAQGKWYHKKCKKQMIKDFMK